MAQNPQRSPLDQFAHQVCPARIPAELVEGDDARMVETRGGLGLPQDAWVAGAGPFEALHGHPALEPLVPGAVDRAETAAAKAFTQHEPVENPLADHFICSFGAWLPPPAPTGGLGAATVAGRVTRPCQCWCQCSYSAN